MRIASIQHGDYLEAVRSISSGQAESYFAMKYSVGVLRELFGNSPHLVVNLDAPRYRERVANGEFVGLPRPAIGGLVPLAIGAAWWSRQVVRELERFAPTHVLLRSGGDVAKAVLRYAIDRKLNTLAVFAQIFDANARNRLAAIVRMLNDPCVRFVGNHKQPATDSMIESGVQRGKCVAWDWPNARRPRDWPVKELRSPIRRIAYAGAMSATKGIFDLLAAVDLLWKKGHCAELVAMGDGADFPAVKARASQMPINAVKLCGRVSNDEVFRQMLEADVLCVPSRHNFPEGMPLSVTEGLASRTPVVISDHPIFLRAFRDGEGVRFFKAEDPNSLAETLLDVFAKPQEYRALSELTAKAFSLVECRQTFGELIERWKATFADSKLRTIAVLT